MKLFVVLLTTLWVSNASFAGDQVTELGEVMAAYTEAKALGHKATTFVHARRAYSSAMKQYGRSSSELAPYAFNYAKAAAEYNSPIALTLYQHALDLYVDTLSAYHPELIPPLIYAAEEALKQNEAEIAYTWLQKANSLLAKRPSQNSVDLARILMGKARLYLNVGDIEKASIYGHKSVAILIPLNDNAPQSVAASLLRWLGEIEKSANNNSAALDAYVKSLNLYELHDKEAREIYDLHKRLVEVNHKLGREENVAFHCLSALRNKHYKHSILREPLYDPSGRLTGLSHQKKGRIRATLIKGADCRLHNIQIHHATGITDTEAVNLLNQAYFTPIIMGGKISDGEYASLVTIDVYEK